MPYTVPNYFIQVSPKSPEPGTSKIRRKEERNRREYGGPNPNDPNLVSKIISRYSPELINKDMAIFAWESFYCRFAEAKSFIPFKFSRKAQPFHVQLKSIKTGKNRGIAYSVIASDPSKSIPNITWAAAMEDPLTPKIQEVEFPDLTLTLSVLCDFHLCTHFLDWKIGINGLLLHFRDKSDRQAVAGKSTMLPDLPVRTGWTRTEIINFLIRQTGYKGAITNRQRNSAVIIRFQLKGISSTFQQYWKERKIQEDKAEGFITNLYHS